MQEFSETHFQFKGQSGFYRGKVRDVYLFDEIVVVIATDRISAFDVIFPQTIPDKGRVLNQIASHSLNATKDSVPNWMTATPDPNVTVGLRCDVFPIEIVVRGYLTGHAWREYTRGKRTLCGVALPNGLRENDPFPTPIITPTTKAEKDQDITRDEIIDRRLVSASHYSLLEKYALKLYEQGNALASGRGLILADTKYEFGKHQGTLYLVDELHTPDSSRYFYKEGYEERQAKGQPQKHLSKEFVRQWLIAKGFHGQKEKPIPHIPDEEIQSISNRYKELYCQMIGYPMEPLPYDGIMGRIEKNVTNFIH